LTGSCCKPSGSGIVPEAAKELKKPCLVRMLSPSAELLALLAAKSNSSVGSMMGAPACKKKNIEVGMEQSIYLLLYNIQNF
jgi:hypothetical protein